MRNKNIADLSITGQTANQNNHGGIVTESTTEDRQRMPNWTRFLNETIARLKEEKAVSEAQREPTKGR